ncbi:BLUF domain-containing protein [Shewanella corallii]|uniref:BLUF domain-containing protein n=1 Tax=Shewanella corallii TaxID=560080 RepID=A0ABT0N878_9GAMM|nr:BLUF domain-containing protein [Shewanella corallii]MCL2914614.1 BLUF domain-containing protein [Shewanella corallii]
MVLKDDALAFLIYISREAEVMTAEALANLLSSAREFNVSKQITGMLLYRDGCFMQVLEGAKADICELFEKIAKDSRHEKVDLLVLEAAERRYFEEWSMGFCDMARPGDKELAGYSAFLRQGLRAANAPLAPCIPSGFLRVFADDASRRSSESA